MNTGQALAAALGRESFGGEPSTAISTDLQPKTYQQEMLEQLANERAHGRTRNLLVAATGTGKTVVAAFDYRNTCRNEGGHPRLLFVAHREEILRLTCAPTVKCCAISVGCSQEFLLRTLVIVRHHRQPDQPQSCGTVGANHSAYGGGG